MPVSSISRRSKPRPKPACGTLPKRRIKQIKDEEERRKPKEFHSGPQEAGQSLGDLLKQKFEESENTPNTMWVSLSLTPGITIG